MGASCSSSRAPSRGGELSALLMPSRGLDTYDGGGRDENGDENEPTPQVLSATTGGGEPSVFDTALMSTYHRSSEGEGEGEEEVGGDLRGPVVDADGMARAFREQGLAEEDARAYADGLYAGLSGNGTAIVRGGDLSDVSKARLHEVLGDHVSRLHLSAILRALLALSTAAATTATPVAASSSGDSPERTFTPLNAGAGGAKKSTHHEFLSTYKTWKERWVPFHHGVVWQTAFAVNGEEFFTATNDHTVGVWYLPRLVGEEVAAGDEPNKWKLRKELKYHVAPVRCVAASKPWLASGGTDRNIIIVSLKEDATKYSMVHSVAGHQDGIRTLCFDSLSAPQLLASGDQNGTVCLTSVEHGHVLRMFRGMHRGPVSDLAFLSPSGSGDDEEEGGGNHSSECTFVSVSWDHTVRVNQVPDVYSQLSVAWPVPAEPHQPTEASSSLVHLRSTFTSHECDVRCLILLADGDHVLTGAEDNQVLLWRLSTGEVVQSMFHGSWVICMALSPCERLLASGGFKTVKLWTCERHGSSEPLSALARPSPVLSLAHEFEAFPNWLKSLRFHPHGYMLLGSSEDTTVNVKVWADAW